jgi:hypothetical protein
MGNNIRPLQANKKIVNKNAITAEKGEPPGDFIWKTLTPLEF